MKNVFINRYENLSSCFCFMLLHLGHPCSWYTANTDKFVHNGTKNVIKWNSFVKHSCFSAYLLCFLLKHWIYHCENNLSSLWQTLFAPLNHTCPPTFIKKWIILEKIYERESENMELTSSTAALVNLFLVVHSFSIPRGQLGIFTTDMHFSFSQVLQQHSLLNCSSSCPIIVTIWMSKVRSAAHVCRFERANSERSLKKVFDLQGDPKLNT